MWTLESGFCVCVYLSPILYRRTVLDVLTCMCAVTEKYEVYRLRGIIKNSDTNFGGREIRLIMERYFRCLLPTKLSSNFWSEWFTMSLTPCHPPYRGYARVWERYLKRRLEYNGANVVWWVCERDSNGAGWNPAVFCSNTWPPSGRIISGNPVSWWSAINVSRPQPWPVWGSYHDSYPQVLHYLENAVDDRYLGRDSNRVRDAGCRWIAFGIILCPINVCLRAVCFVSRHTYT